MKLQITVFKEQTASAGARGFAGRELLVEGLGLGARYVGKLSGPAESEVSGQSVPELMGKIKEAVGTIRREEREIQFKFAPEEEKGGKVRLEGDEISEVFRGIESLMEPKETGEKK